MVYFNGKVGRTEQGQGQSMEVDLSGKTEFSNLFQSQQIEKSLFLLWHQYCFYTGQSSHHYGHLRPSAKAEG